MFGIIRQSGGKFSRRLINFRSSSSFEPKLNEEKNIVRSPYPDITPVSGVHMPDLIWAEHAKRSHWGKMTCTTCGITGRSYTFEQAFRITRGFAAALMKSGLKRRDVVAVLLPNIPEYPFVFLGIIEAGLVPSPINSSYTPDEIKRQIESSNAKMTVTIEMFLPAVRAAKESLKDMNHIVVVGQPQEGCHTFGEMIKSDIKGVEFFKGSEIDEDVDIAFLPYSSGTTGPPKGVILTHKNITSNLIQNIGDISIVKSADEGEQERLIGLLPFFHSYGLCAILFLGFYQGANILCLPRFDPQGFIQAIKQHRPTVLHLVTPLITFLLATANMKEDFKSLHSVLAGAAPVGSSLISRFVERIDHYIFFQEGYGMTELSPVSHLLSPTTKNTKMGSCGTPVASTLSKVVSLDTGEALGPNELGEILVKGPQMMRGYLNNEEATKATITHDGWLKTGDIGYMDGSHFYIVDRVKELIKVKGLQVSPSELEEILRQHDQVSDVAVIGVPDAEWGEAPRAYIVKKDDEADFNENHVHDFLFDKVAPFKRLKGGIEFVYMIPKAASGKILRRELSVEYKEKHSK